MYLYIKELTLYRADSGDSNQTIGGILMKYRIRCGDYYYCGMAYKNGTQYQRWEKDFCIPLEMNFNDACCTLSALLETGKFIEMPVLEPIGKEKATYEG